VIKSLSIRNFKRFVDADFSFGALTVLTGLNSAGKSTVIQSLLLARQAAEKKHSVIQLNGPYGLTLGEAKDVLSETASSSDISFIIESTSTRQGVEFKFNADDEQDLNLKYEVIGDTPKELCGLGGAFAYLTAERLGPRDMLGVTAEDIEQLGVGTQGEFTGQVLALHETRQVPEHQRQVRPELRMPAMEERLDIPKLRTQAEYWASHIISPIQIMAQRLPQLSASIIRYSEPGALGEQRRPTNVGFGVSYSLPIIVAGLLMPRDGLLIVENPEAHLHPAGQSRLGRFLGRVAGSGAQVVVETHSDHVINGIRLAAVADRVIEPSDILIHFFESDIHTIKVSPKGTLSYWPKGFFDQIEEDLETLARAKRSLRGQS
jgi:predicted ATPase